MRLSLRSKVARYRAFWAGQERRASSAGVALYTPAGEVLVVKSSYKEYWSFPGGVVDAGETPRIAALRELREETGLTLPADALTFSMVVDRVSVVAQTYQFIFESQVDSSLFTNIDIDNDETVEWALVSRELIVHGDRPYSATVVRWARGDGAYAELQIGKNVGS